MLPNELLKSLPAPKKGDVLFKAGQRVNARVGGQFPEYIYMEGYRRAAQLLAKHVCTEQRDQHFLVYPIVYLYRHHIELILKQLTVVGAWLIDADLSSKQIADLERHQLNQLWANFKPILKRVCKAYNQKLSPEDLEGVDSYIRQLSAVDLDGQAFRYSRTKKGETSTPNTLSSMSIGVFAEHMEQLAAFLAKLDNWLSALENAKMDLHASYE
jgi:hypothetical protein